MQNHLLDSMFSFFPSKNDFAVTKINEIDTFPIFKVQLLITTKILYV